MNLLIQESPLLILPTLAEKIGVDEAIILQQLHFRLNNHGQERNGKIWYCQTYAKWAQQMPFWSESKIKRIFIKLEKLGLVISTDKYNTFYVDRTKWYSIDYDAIEALFYAQAVKNQTAIVNAITVPPSIGKPSERTLDERSNIKDFKDVQKEKEEKGDALAHPSLLTSNLQDDTKDNRNEHISKDTQIDQIIQYLNNKTGKQFNPKTAANRKLIQARLHDGYTVNDCYQVIDNQVALWLKEPKMQPYLRPQTLFRASNFESYLNNSTQLQEHVYRQPTQVELDFNDN